MKPLLLISAVLLQLVLACNAAGSKSHEIRFPPGSSSTQVSGSVKGYDFVTYQLRAQAGQQMRVVMDTSHSASYFNIFPPGKGPGDAAIFIGSTSGNRFSQTLPADGVYTIQVYLMRSAARREESARYTLDIAITGP
ncbi:Inhibitor of g-type lysozyme precursor [Microbulbifer aggregans]|uniref:Inhibitor of g-type lysozyme n=1 Tax=Microbulbifer aggregans TaxID=1769779 RepID=A0A1C9WBA6_9GAMM|nr:hypothetical protein [Microbulbifer aggregans]AOS98433.1 Inhibitor of g-type lysozyme precursor [Microbulbifer aggregans]